MYSTIVIYTLLTYLVVNLSAQCLTEHDERPPRTEDLRALYTGQRNLSLDMLKVINQNDAAANVFFSPYSTYSVLLVTYLFSNGNTENALHDALRIPVGQDKVNALQAYHIDQYSQQQNSLRGYYEFNSANRLYVSSQSEPKKCIEELFRNELKKVNFQNNANDVRKEINEWVDNTTRGHIKNLLSEDAISEQTNLVTVNAAYFKGYWQIPFESLFTRNQTFYLSENKTAVVEMMFTMGSFNYTFSKTLDANIIQLPYIGEDVSLIAILPEKRTNVHDVLEKLNDESFQEIMHNENITPTELMLSFPKFSIETSYNLKPVLEKLGFQLLFGTSSQLSLLITTNDTFFDSIHHKAKIIINEEGSEASAATNILTNRFGNEYPEISFNRPFIYFILTREENIYFSGIYKNP